MDFLEEELEEILKIFREESDEQIQKLNQNLLKLEKKPTDKFTVTELFRDAHSLKGAARMIGLTDIQSLAHKLEDILGMAKDDGFIITSDVVDLLCKTVDCISSIIEKSVSTKGEFHCKEVDDILELLEKVENLDELKKSEKNDLNSESKEDIKKIKIEEKIEFTELDLAFYEGIADLLPQISSFVEDLFKNPSDSSVIVAFHQLIVNIDVAAQCINNAEIKDKIFDLKTKLDSVIKGSGILLKVEVEELKELCCDFIDLVDSIKMEEKVFKPTEVKQQEAVIEVVEDVSASTKIVLNDFESSIKSFNDKILLLSDSDDVVFELIELINNITAETKNENAKLIFRQIGGIIENIKELKNKPEKEILEVIKQSLQVASNIVLDPEKAIDEDPSLIMQRLSILQQMLELSDQANLVDVVDEKESRSFSETKRSDLVPGSATRQEVSQKESLKSSESGAIKTLRVDTRKLDQLVSQVGELIIAKIKIKDHLAEIDKINRGAEDWYREWNKSKKHFKNHLRKASTEPGSVNAIVQGQHLQEFFDESSGQISEFMNGVNSLYRTVQEDNARLNLIVNELEQMIKGVRVLPLATIFHMFPRMVRDIARSKNKDIELVISGSETSVDKKIIEEIKSPLTHIMRNAIDHGLETPEEREKNGKNPQGKIFLTARHLENRVLIEVIDDGRGVDIEKIKKKVLQKELLSQAELDAMSETQIMNIIFWPGFSTGDSVTDISGRGIGLDVVHTKINQLNGKVSIKSKLGEGCKVSIQLPVSMATIKSFLIDVCGQTFAVPTSVIKTVFWAHPKDVFLKEGKQTLIVDNKTVPVYKLSELLELKDEKVFKENEKMIVLVIQNEDSQIGIVIDKLIGEQEILHKKLKPPLVRVRNIAGVTTLAAGELCLILNVNDLMKSANQSTMPLSKNLYSSYQEETIEGKAKVLVVDDSMTTRILERNILRTAGFEVAVAVNGLDALTKLNAEKFDLVVSDIEMPEINGIELTRRIKTDDAFKNIPVILVSSIDSSDYKLKAQNVGANAQIVKGKFDQNELISKVKELLQRQKKK